MVPLTMNLAAAHVPIGWPKLWSAWYHPWGVRSGAWTQRLIWSYLIVRDCGVFCDSESSRVLVFGMTMVGRNRKNMGKCSWSCLRESKAATLANVLSSLKIWTSISVPPIASYVLADFEERKAIHPYLPYLIVFHCSSRIRRITGKSTWQSSFSSFRLAWSCHVLLLGNWERLESPQRCSEWDQHQSDLNRRPKQCNKHGLQMASIPRRWLQPRHLFCGSVRAPKMRQAPLSSNTMPNNWLSPQPTGQGPF